MPLKQKKPNVKIINKQKRTTKGRRKKQRKQVWMNKKEEEMNDCGKKEEMNEWGKNEEMNEWINERISKDGRD